MRHSAQRPDRTALETEQSKLMVSTRELTLLAATELLDSLLLVEVLRVERHTDTNTSVVFNCTSSLSVRFLWLLTSVGSALNHQAAVTGRNQFTEDGGKFLGDLLESTLNGFVLAAIEMLDEFFDRPLRIVQLFASLHQLVLLGGEAVVLLKGLLVDVLVLLESLVHSLEFRVDLQPC